MVQVTSQALFPPLLLATDGSASARFAQRLLYPIAQLLQSSINSSSGSNSSNGHSGDPGSDTGHDSSRAVVTVLTVQPRRSSRSKKPSNPPETMTTEGNGEPSPLTTPDRLVETIQAEFPPTLTVTIQVRRGRPTTEILNYARANQAGLIAVGQQGRSGMRELLLGSVSSVVARYAPCSVLIARGDESISEPSLRHVLVVVDGSIASQSAIAMTRQLIPAGVEQVTLLCPQLPVNARYLFGPFVAPNPSWQLNQSLQTAQREEGERILQAARRGLDAPQVTIETLLPLSGEPGSRICQIATQRQVDLVILGSDVTRRSLLAPLQSLRRSSRPPAANPPRSPLRNTRLSATEDYTIHHSPCSVLLCRVVLD